MSQCFRGPLVSVLSCLAEDLLFLNMWDWEELVHVEWNRDVRDQEVLGGCTNSAPLAR